MRAPYTPSLASPHLCFPPARTHPPSPLLSPAPSPLQHTSPPTTCTSGISSCLEMGTSSATTCRVRLAIGSVESVGFGEWRVRDGCVAVVWAGSKG